MVCHKLKFPFWLVHSARVSIFLAVAAVSQAQMSTSSVASINNLKNAAGCSDTSVSANTITCSTAVGFTGYAALQAVDVLLANTVTGATTININGLGAKAVTYNGTNALTSAIGWVAGSTGRLVYDGTRFVMEGIVAAASACPGGSAGQVQFNVSAGVCGGDSNLTWDNTTKTLAVGTSILSSLGSVSLPDGIGGISIVGNYAYVNGAYNSTNDFRFAIVDISNRSAPHTVGTLVDPLMSSAATNMIVYGEYAFIVTDDVAGAYMFEVVNVSNPKAPVFEGGLTGLQFGTRHAWGIAVQGHYAYVGSYLGTGTVWVVDIIDPEHPVVVSSASTGISNKPLYSLAVQGDYLYAAHNDGVYIFNVSDPANVTVAGHVTDTATMNGAYALTVRDRYVYVVNDVEDATPGTKSLAVVDVSDPTTPVVAASVENSDIASDGYVYLYGKFLYVAAIDAAFVNAHAVIYDVSNPVSPSLVSSVSSVSNGAFPFLAVSGGVMLYTPDAATLYLYNISHLTLGSADIGSINAGEVQANNAVISNYLAVGSGMAVGPRGLFSQGPVAGESVAGTVFRTGTNCSDSAGAAACGTAAAGAVVIDAAATTTVVSTTAVTANSEITLTFDPSLATRLSVTCNAVNSLPYVSARTPGTSFTIKTDVAPITNPACISYSIVN